ncbi:ESX-1 secretion-associated protein EspB-like [Trichosurus vulpecula]|uniref:ESX-1 secretion-associated protein EspB-like n=1 Tax=Trichosurus vulpecula TaxID=9337 RepID=UPI00186B0F50|nr:ESX-1 secretion-associated protein EspB-like [Trichosurus vulpecula]
MAAASRGGSRQPVSSGGGGRASGSPARCPLQTFLPPRPRGQGDSPEHPHQKQPLEPPPPPPPQPRHSSSSSRGSSSSGGSSSSSGGSSSSSSTQSPRGAAAEPRVPWHCPPSPPGGTRVVPGQLTPASGAGGRVGGGEGAHGGGKSPDWLGRAAVPGESAPSPATQAPGAGEPLDLGDGRRSVTPPLPAWHQGHRALRGGGVGVQGAAPDRHCSRGEPPLLPGFWG